MLVSQAENMGIYEMHSLSWAPHALPSYGYTLTTPMGQNLSTPSVDLNIILMITVLSLR